MSDSTIILPFQPASMSTAQLAAVSYLARYSGHTHALYAYQLREWFSWCEVHGLDPRAAVQRGACGVVHSPTRRPRTDGLVSGHNDARLRGNFRFAHIDGHIPLTRLCTRGCRRCTATSPALKDWTGLN